MDDVEEVIAFYQDVFNLEKLNEGEGDAFFKLGQHQFLAMFEVKFLVIRSNIATSLQATSFTDTNPPAARAVLYSVGVQP